MLGEYGGDARDFLKRQKEIALQELVLTVEYLLGHTVGTPEVTAIRDGNPKIAQGSIQGIKCAGALHY